MAAWKCGWCGLYGHKEPVDNGWQVPFTEKEMLENYLPPGSRIFTTMECNACQGRSVAMTMTSDMPYGVGTLSDVKEFWRENDPVQVSPQWVEGKDFDFVPDHIADTASEAFMCHSIGAHRAAILMARAAIEAAAKNNDVRTGNLASKIETLAEQGLIRPPVKVAADELRLSGNEMAHDELTDPVEEDYAADVLLLLTAILKELYETQVLSRRIRDSREGREESTSESEDAQFGVR